MAVTTVLLPWLSPKIAGKYNIRLHPAPVWLPLLAAAVYITSLYLPDVDITRETDTFQQHFVGGGVYTAILYVYFSKLLGWRPHWIVALLTLFAWTSALGVVNEVLEFTLVKLNITQINLADTSWDLFANTTGSLTGYAFFRIGEAMRSLRAR